MPRARGANLFRFLLGGICFACGVIVCAAAVRIGVDGHLPSLDSCVKIILFAGISCSFGGISVMLSAGCMSDASR
jgi:hypothetical protein